MPEAGNFKEKEKQVVIFDLINQIYGVDISNVLEIIRPQAMTIIPGSPDYVEGIINLRGQIIPIIDLAKRFKLQTNTETDDRIIVVVEAEKIKLGLLVDRVLGVQKFDPALIQPPPALIDGINTQYLIGTVLMNNQLLILLNINFVYEEQGKEFLSSFREASSEEKAVEKTDLGLIM
ncbi:MAG: chemotaxis protein CheW [Peptococcaceae bacterium]